MNDLIRRQDAIDAVHEEFDTCLVWDESGRRTADEFETIIDRLPSARPEINKEELRRMIRAGIVATNTKDVYSCGMRNGM